MIIKAYIRPPTIEGAWHPLMALPTDLRPEFFSSEEEAKKVEGSIHDTTNFVRFTGENRFGFFLFAERARYNLTVRASEAYCTLSVDALTDRFDESDSLAVFKALAENGLAFAFAAHVG